MRCTRPSKGNPDLIDRFLRFEGTECPALAINKALTVSPNHPFKKLRIIRWLCSKCSMIGRRGAVQCPDDAYQAFSSKFLLNLLVALSAGQEI